MTKLMNLNRKQAEMLLASVIVARSSAYMFAKMVLGSMGLFNLLAVRFLLAFLILGIIFRKRLIHADRKTWLMGASMGVVFFGVMVAETSALMYTDTSVVSFLENTAVVLVPLFCAFLLHKRPGKKDMAGAAVALAGVGLLTLKSGALVLTAGHVFGIIAAVFYALVIIMTAGFSRKADAVSIGVIQVGVMGSLSLISSLVFETPHLPGSVTEWGFIMVLVIVCTVFGFTLQPVAQKNTSPQTAGLMCALNPVAACILGVVFLKEEMGLLGVAGAVLILISLFLPRLLEKIEKRHARKKAWAMAAKQSNFNNSYS